MLRFVLAAVAAVAVFLPSARGAGYDLGGTDPICWNYQTNNRVACPEGLGLQFVVPPPNPTKIGTEVSVTFKLTATSAFLSSSASKGYLSHMNIHACPTGVAGSCTPYGGFGQSIFTMTPEVKCGTNGDQAANAACYGQDNTQKFTLSSDQPGWTIHGTTFIVHVDIGSEISMAIGVLRTVLPAIQVNRITSAVCSFRATDNNAGPVTGNVRFEQLGSINDNVNVTWDIQGISSGDHSWHVHVLGDISQDYDAQSVTGHFVGAGVSRGPPCTKDCNEVGMIGGDAKITADGSGRSTGQLLDEFIRLNGVNSIVGRSIVIHGIEGNTGARAAWCVVGLDTQTTELVDDAPTPDSAIVRLQGTTAAGGASAIDGYMRFITYPNSGASCTSDAAKMKPPCATRVEYVISGLSPGAHGYHVHIKGDITDPTATATTGHFVDGGDPISRPWPCAALCQEVGMLDGGIKMQVNAGGIATGVFYDPYVTLTGKNSILGRSIVVHGVVGNSGTRAAMGVIGRADLADHSSNYVALPGPPAAGPSTGVNFVRAAHCKLQATDNNPNKHLSGYVDFEQLEGDATMPNGALGVRWAIAGLNGTSFSWHIHTMGDLIASTGLSVTGHYIGKGISRDSTTTDTKVKPAVACPKACNEVAMIGNAATISKPAPTNGVAAGYLKDSYMSLNGENSIIGRSIIIHGTGADGGSGKRVAQCVIGIAYKGEKTDNIQQIAPYREKAEAATCFMQSVNQGDNSVSGYVRFEKTAAKDGTATTSVKWMVAGLSPGEHGWHIHDFGDLAAGSYGQYTGGHFIGTVPAERQEVGLIGDGAKIVADAGGFSFGSINDKYMELEGKNSILGRSIVIHGTATNSSARVAMCVIGRSSLTPPETPCKEGGSGDSTGDSGNSTNTPTPTPPKCTTSYAPVVGAAGVAVGASVGFIVTLMCTCLLAALRPETFQPGGPSSLPSYNANNAAGNFSSTQMTPIGGVDKSRQMSIARGPPALPSRPAVR